MCLLNVRSLSSREGSSYENGIAKIHSACCRFCRMDCSKHDSHADSEMPNVSGYLHRTLDWDRAFDLGRDLSASIALNCLRRVDSVSRCEKRASPDVYEVQPRKDHRGVNLISDALSFGRLWYGEPDAVTNASTTQSFSAGHMNGRWTGNRHLDQLSVQVRDIGNTIGSRHR